MIRVEGGKSKKKKRENRGNDEGVPKILSKENGS